MLQQIEGFDAELPAVETRVDELLDMLQQAKLLTAEYRRQDAVQKASKEGSSSRQVSPGAQQRRLELLQKEEVKVRELQEKTLSARDELRILQAKLETTKSARIKCESILSAELAAAKERRKVLERALDALDDGSPLPAASFSDKSHASLEAETAKSIETAVEAERALAELLGRKSDAERRLQAARERGAELASYKNFGHKFW